MRILYVCRAVDDNARWTAAQVQWIVTLAEREDVEHVHVLSTRAGKATLPENVTLRGIRRGRLGLHLLSFWWEVLKARPWSLDFFLVVQGGPYPALLLPFKLLTGRPIYQWKAHALVSGRMRFYAKYCDDLVFTATEHSLRISTSNKRVIGHGIDTTLFRPANALPDRDFVTVGRISPIKGLDVMIDAVAACRECFGIAPNLDVIGGCDPKGQSYLQRLEAQIKQLGLEEHVRLVGHVDYQQLPSLLPRYRAALNFSGGAFDKAVGEAMACGVPVLTTNEAVIESLSPELRTKLAVTPADPERAARALFGATKWNEKVQSELAVECRQFIVSHHSLIHLFDAMLREIGEDRRHSRT